jgi:hypothetical protein
MPKTPRRTTATADEVMATHTPEVRALVERIRAVIFKAVPDVVETANLGWHSLSFTHPAAGYFCGLFPKQDEVEMVFEFGVLLPDPEGLFDRLGRQVGFINIRRPRDIRARPLKQLLRSALSLPASRQARMEMIRAGATVNAPPSRRPL